MKLIVKTLAGLEGVLAAELEALGAAEIVPGKRAVYCEGDKTLLYRANLELRTALRVLTPVRTCQVFDENALYVQVQNVDWSQYMDADDTLAIDAVTHSKYFRHSQYVALKTKDAIVDQFRDRTGRRPSVDTENPHLRINVHISDDQCTIALDSSGDSLHKRGYRSDALAAPINEVLAAGMVLLSGWKRDCPFIDPMCGSGTIAIEAALYAWNIPPQLYRQAFGFMRWADFDPLLWGEVRGKARGAISLSFKHPVMAFDKNMNAVKIAQQNAINAHLEGKIRFDRRRFETLAATGERGVLIMNPPYDTRLVEDNIEGLYRMIGDRLKKAFTGYDAWVISANQDALKQVGLRTSQKYTLYNGALECKFVKFELYQGTRKTTAHAPKEKP